MATIADMVKVWMNVTAPPESSLAKEDDELQSGLLPNATVSPVSVFKRKRASLDEDDDDTPTFKVRNPAKKRIPANMDVTHTEKAELKRLSHVDAAKDNRRRISEAFDELEAALEKLGHSTKRLTKERLLMLAVEELSKGNAVNA